MKRWFWACTLTFAPLVSAGCPQYATIERIVDPEKVCLAEGGVWRCGPDGRDCRCLGRP